MKPVALFLLVACVCGTAFGQTPPRNIFLVQTFKTVFPEGGSARERDSLLAEYIEHVVKKNDKILSERNFQHYFGKDSRDWIRVREYRSVDDYEAATAVSQELSRKRWPDAAKRAEFFRKLQQYWEPVHSDEVLRALPGLSK